MVESWTKDPPAGGDAPKSFQLVLMQGGKRRAIYRLTEGLNVIGRWDPDHGAFPEIDLEEEDNHCKVSRKHALVECKDGVVTLEDLGSLNGTYVNRGARLEPGTKQIVQAGDEIIVGKLFLLLERAAE
jgi:pSer/pThr/pTyr-binding forkhead associated (FHA) protein